MDNKIPLRQAESDGGAGEPSGTTIVAAPRPPPNPRKSRANDNRQRTGPRSWPIHPHTRSCLTPLPDDGRCQGRRGALRATWHFSLRTPRRRDGSRAFGAFRTQHKPVEPVRCIVSATALETVGTVRAVRAVGTAVFAGTAEAAAPGGNNKTRAMSNPRLRPRERFAR